MTWLRKWRSTVGWKTQTAGMFVAHKEEEGQANTVEAALAEDLDRVWWHNIVFHPPATLFPEGGATDVFTEDSIVGNKTSLPN